jgi:hypothetical protein
MDGNISFPTIEEIGVVALLAGTLSVVMFFLILVIFEAFLRF